MLKIAGLTKRYGKFYAVKGIDLELQTGEIFGFVGPNGAGKTTTMKIIAGLIEKTAGTVWVKGLDISRHPKEYKRYVGYMPDFFGVYDDLKVLEYLNFYAGVHGITKQNRGHLSERMLALVNLSAKKNAYVDALSRGMKQRLCLARCLMHDPELLILDEPASGLDPRARIEMKEILRELKHMGKTIIISSHILPELAEMCTSIGIIENGKMVVRGHVSEILNQVQQHPVIRITALSSMEEIRRFLMEKPHVLEMQVDAEKLEFSYGGEAEALAGILKEMIQRDFQILSFAPLEKNLESIFMQITREENGHAQSGD